MTMTMAKRVCRRSLVPEEDPRLLNEADAHFCFTKIDYSLAYFSSENRLFKTLAVEQAPISRWQSVVCSGLGT